MDSSIRRSIWTRVILVTLLCLLAAGAGAYQLYLDLNQAGQAGMGPAVGTVERKDSKVRRKASSSYVWTNVNKNENLFKKDSIQTGGGSAVSIRMKDGNLLDIGENSLVVMDDTADLSLNFLRGSVVVHKRDGDQKISVGKDGKSQVEELKVRLLQPLHLGRFFIPGQGQRAIHFAWQANAKQNSIQHVAMQISFDPRFNPQQTQTLAVVPEFDLKLARGQYFWRLVADGQVLSETRKFQISQVSPLQGVWPPENNQIQIQPGQNSSQFRWIIPSEMAGSDQDLGLGEHQLELAKDAEFKTPLHAEKVNAGSGLATIAGLPNGRIFWRMKSQYDNFSIVGATKSFELISKVEQPPPPVPEKIPLPPPRIKSPEVQ